MPKKDAAKKDAKKDAVRSFSSDVGDFEQKDDVRSFYKKDAVKGAPHCYMTAKYCSSAAECQPFLPLFTLPRSMCDRTIG